MDKNNEEIKLDFQVSNFYFAAMLKLIIKIIEKKLIRKHGNPDVKGLSNAIASIYLITKNEIISKQDLTLSETEQKAIEELKETLKEYLE